MKKTNGKIVWKKWENRRGEEKAHALIAGTTRCLCGSLVQDGAKPTRAPSGKGACTFCRQLVKNRARVEERAG